MKNLIISVLLFSSCATQGQHDQVSLTLNEYFDLMQQKNVSEALDYVHPDLINMLGKPAYEEQYNQLFNTPGIEVEMNNFSIDTLSQTYINNQKKYVLIDYSFKMIFKVDITKDESGLLSDVLLSSYQSRFGKKNVISDTPGTYRIQIERELFAVEDSAFEGWKIIDFEEGMRIMIVDIIPEEVLKHFNR